MGVELCKILTGNADMAIVNISIPPLRRVRCGDQSFEAAKIPLFLRTNLKPTEVLSRCHTSKELRKKKLQEL